MATPETLALDICRVKGLNLSDREYRVLVDYLSKDIDTRYRKIMKWTQAQIVMTLGLERRSARSLSK